MSENSPTRFTYAQLRMDGLERRKRLANIISPEFEAWFETYIAELASQPMTELEEYVRQRTQGQPGICITYEPRPGLDTSAPQSSLSLIRKPIEENLPALADRKN
jgi:hypothetical protein